MQEIKRRKTIAVDWRARLPLLTRVLALFVIVAGIVFVGISYYRSRNNKPFVMIPGAPELSKQVTSVVEGYERRVTEGDRLRLLLREVFTAAGGSHDDWAEYDRVMAEQRRTAVLVTATRVYGS